MEEFDLVVVGAGKSRNQALPAPARALESFLKLLCNFNFSLHHSFSTLPLNADWNAAKVVLKPLPALCDRIAWPASVVISASQLSSM